jgi:DNA-binding winged helix-turn-helix (wHTH) protein/Tol biopolymer transport system component
MLNPSTNRLRIGRCLLDLQLHRIYRDGNEFQLTPRAMAVLNVLLQNPGVPLSRDALILQVWGTPHVTNDVVTKAIKELRKQFGETEQSTSAEHDSKLLHTCPAAFPASPQASPEARHVTYIETLPKIGYRLIAPVAPMAVDFSMPTTPVSQAPKAPEAEPEKLTRIDLPEGGALAIGAAESALVAMSTPETAEHGATASHAPADTLRTSEKPRRVSRAMLIGMLATITMLAATVWLISRSASRNSALRTAADASILDGLRAKLLLNLKPLLAGSAQEGSPAISPDGKWLAYTRLEASDAGPVVMLRGVNEMQARRVSNVPAEAELNPRWSRDGQQIAFLRFSERGCELVLAPLVVGAERVITHCESTRQEFYEFTPDAQGMLLFRADAKSAGRAVMQRLNFADGVLSALEYPRSASEEDVQALYAPDQHKLLLRRGLLPNSDLYLRLGDGNALQRVTHIDARIRGFTWLADSRHVVLSSDHGGIPELWLLDTSTQQLARLGGANAQFPDLNLASGRLVFERAEQITHLQSIRMNDSPDTLSQPPRQNPPLEAAQITADVPWRAQFASARSESFPMLDLQTRKIAFISDRSGASALYFAALSNDAPFGAPAAEVRGGINVNAARLAFSPDGKVILATRRSDKGNTLLRIDTESLAERQLARNFDVRHACFLDARRVVFEGKPSTAQGQAPNTAATAMQLWLLASADSDPAPALTTDGGARPWCVAGQLYFLRPPELNLYRMTHLSGQSELISRRISGWNQAAWTVTERAVYYLDTADGAAPGLYRLDLRSKAITLVAPWKNELNAAGIAVDEASHSVIMGMISGADSDVMQVPEFAK